jgi:hypothetical protein
MFCTIYMSNIEYNAVQYRIVQKSIVCIDQDFHTLYRIVHNIVMSWFVDVMRVQVTVHCCHSHCPPDQILRRRLQLPAASTGMERPGKFRVSLQLPGRPALHDSESRVRFCRRSQSTVPVQGPPDSARAAAWMICCHESERSIRRSRGLGPENLNSRTVNSLSGMSVGLPNHRGRRRQLSVFNHDHNQLEFRVVASTNPANLTREVFRLSQCFNGM